MQSSIYEGRVRHRRLTPTEHAFSYRVFMMYLDLDELPTLFSRRWLWSARRPALARFERSNYHGDAQLPLADAVRATIERETGRRPTGPIRVLTNLSYFGYCFNPLSLYYCFEPAGGLVEAVLADVSNTPWRERHAYVLDDPAQRSERIMRFHSVKSFHVSPFMPMDLEYDWRLAHPGDTLTAHIETRRDDAKVFDATLTLERTAMTGPAMARVLAAYPFMTAKVVAAIHWQALRLWLKRVPFFAHPDKLGAMKER